MTSSFPRRQVLQAGVAGAAGLALPALAQSNFPSRPIKLICPWPAGGSSDIVMRALAVAATKVLGQQVVIENKPGASGMLGPNELVKAAPDGYTLMVGTNSTNAALKSLMKKLPYDQDTAFAPIGYMGSVPLIVAVAVPSRNTRNFGGELNVKALKAIRERSLWLLDCE